MLWYNNTFFVNRMADELCRVYQDQRVEEVFSTTKNDLFLVFGSAQTIHLRWMEGYLLVQFKERHHLPNKNRLQALKPLVGENVEHVIGVPLSRAIEFHFGEMTLVLKMFGRNSNAILYENQDFVERFILKGNKDDELALSDVRSGFNMEDFEQLLADGKSDYLVEKRLIHPEMAEAVRTKGFATWRNLTNWISQQHFHYVKERTDSNLIQVKLETASQSTHFLEEVGRFASEWAYARTFKLKRQQGLKNLEKQIHKAKKTLHSTQTRLQHMAGSQYQNMADLIMANLYNIEPEQTKLHVSDFYTGEPITIKLNPRLSPQKNAERYYRKAKNQHKEEDNLQSRIKELERQIAGLQEDYNELDAAESLKKLKKMELADPVVPSSVPYRKYMVDGFVVLVGKSASNNDELIKRYAHKEDLWFHARGVKGSHVILQCQGGSVPMDTVEKVASLAAFYSKDKSSELVPVIYTRRKYIRKFKGAPPGAVKVDREEVIIVPPLDVKKQ